MEGSHYSTARARRSLIQFIIGKGLTAVVGIFVLLFSVRIMAPGDFGLYVAVIAFMEIFYLATGFGLSTIAQRYVAEFRIKTSGNEFTKFLKNIILRRVLYAVGGTTAVGITAAIWVGLGNSTPLSVQFPTFYILLIFGCTTRFANEIFSALLLQGYTQSLVLGTHLIKLAGLLGCMAIDRAVGFQEMLSIEVAASMLGTIGSLFLLRRYLVADFVADSMSPPNASTYSNPLMLGVARRFYVVQLLGQIWGPNTGKLIVAQFLGLVATATYGFVQSITDMLRNYLPAYLLSSWLRPLMISRYLEKGDLHEANAMASLMFKLSLLCIVPAAAFFAASGDGFIAWASGGKIFAGSALLVLFCTLLALQCLHVVIGMITITVERARASVIATTAACAGFPLSVAGAHYLGLLGVIGGMIAGECVWIGTVLILLRREGLHIKLETRGILLIFLSAIPAFAAVKLLPLITGPLSVLSLSVIGIVVTGLLVLATNALCKPFTEFERSFIVRLVPRRYFIL